MVGQGNHKLADFAAPLFRRFGICLLHLGVQLKLASRFGLMSEALVRETEFIVCFA